MKIFDKKSIAIITLGELLFFSLFSFIPYEWVPHSILLALEITKSFTPYLVIFNLLAIVGLFWGKFPHRKLLSVIVLIIVYCQCRSGITRNRTYDSSSTTKYTIFYSNVLFSNTNYNDLKERIKSYNPDFVALLEMDKNWRKNFDLPDYPYKSGYDKDFLGMVFYSKYPIKNHRLVSLNYARPLLENEIELPDGTIHINVLHLPPPFSAEHIELRNKALKVLGKFLSEQNDNVITLGDYNVTQFSSAFKELIKDSGVSQCSTDLYPPILNLFYTTWCHSSLPFACTGIDHTLVKGKLILSSIEKVQNFGSDHIPLLITFTPKPVKG